MKKALARRLLGKRKGSRIVFEPGICLLKRGDDELGRLPLAKVPNPKFVVTSVMRRFWGYESHVGSIRCLTEEPQGPGLTPRDAKLAHNGKVRAALSRLRTTEARVIWLMHSANGSLTRPEICRETGLPDGALMRYYERALVDAAAGFIKKGVFEVNG